MTELTDKACELCNSEGGELLWRDAFCRVVLVADPDYPGFCRVIVGEHVKEMTDLAPAQRARLMDAVYAAESARRDLAAPDKVNLASFGNAVPHVHWHVIPRWRDDRHFPAPVWAAPSREARRRAAPDRAAMGARLARLLG